MTEDLEKREAKAQIAEAIVNVPVFNLDSFAVESVGDWLTEIVAHRNIGLLDEYNILLSESLFESRKVYKACAGEDFERRYFYGETRFEAIYRAILYFELTKEVHHVAG